MSSMAWIPISCLITLGACSAPPQPAQSPPPPAQPATVARLKAVTMVAGPGTAQFVGWYDSQLDVECELRPLGGASLGCYPTGRAVARVHETVYADAGCTEPLADLEAGPDWYQGCPAPRFAYRREDALAGGCDSSPTMLHVGERVHLPRVYRRAGGCIPQPPRVGPSALGLYRVRPFDREELPTGWLEAGPSADGIAPVHFVTADGARQMWGFRDAVGGFDCFPQPTTAGVRCVPTDLAYIAGLFSDPLCTVPAAMPLICRDRMRPSIPFVSDNFHVSEGAGQRIFEGGQRLPTVYRNNGTSCQADPTATGFAIGPEIPASRFVPGAPETRAAAAGLQLASMRAGGQVLPLVLRQAAFGGRPTLRHHDCHFAPTADGVLRCVPDPGWGIGVLYADDGCTRPVVPSEQTLISVPDRSTCPARVRVYSRGPEHFAAVWRRDGDTCTFESARSPTSVRAPYFLYDTEVSPDRLVPVTRVLR